MAAFVLVANANIDSFAGKTGGDTFDTAGFNLTIDQDSRTGLNATTATSLGNLTVTATSGGNINIDGTAIWMIPYTAGAGNVPAFNTVITNGTGTGRLIGVHASLVAASTATGAVMPATGFIRVKQKSGNYAAGALTGISATASDLGRIGYIEIVGDEASTINANRLGTVNILGAWLSLGTTNGVANQTLQIPNNGLTRYAAGVFIEKVAAGGDFEFYPNAGLTTTTGVDVNRGKVCWIDATGLVRLGNSGAAVNGFTPVTGLAVVIGNVFLENCTAAARTANVIPNAVVATRYDFTTTGGGVVVIDKCNMGWYLSCSQAYSVTLSNSGFVDGIFLSEIASPMTFSKVGVGNKPTTALLMSPLTMTFCFAGGTFTDCVWARVSHATAGAHTNQYTDVAGFTFIRDVIRANTIRANATAYAINGTRMNNCTWTNPVIIQGSISLTTCDNVNTTGVVYIDAVSGTTQATNGMSVWLPTANTTNCTFSGLTFPVTDNQAFVSLLGASSGCANIKLRNIGTRIAPLNLGSVNNCGLIYSLVSACFDIKIQRIYAASTRTGIASTDNSSKGVTEENVFGDYTDALDVMSAINMSRKGAGGVGALTAQIAVYGTHWFDCFTSTTAGRLGIFMNESTSNTSAQAVVSAGAAFTSAGGLFMSTVGRTAVFETPNYVIGHTAFANTALIMAGGVAGNYTYRYQIDKNDGLGYSAFTAGLTATTLGTSLSAQVINFTLGFKLRLEIVTSTANTAVITNVYLTTVSSTVAQDVQYPLDTTTITFSGLPTGCDIVVLAAGTTTILTSVDALLSTSFSYTYAGTPSIDIGFIKIGLVPQYIRGLVLTLTNTSIPVSLTPDRNFV